MKKLSRDSYWLWFGWLFAMALALSMTLLSAWLLDNLWICFSVGLIPISEWLCLSIGFCSSIGFALLSILALVDNLIEK